MGIVDRAAGAARAEEAPAATGDGNGWTLGMLSQTKTQLGDESWSTQTTRFDTNGNTIETRQPDGTANADGTGADTHSVDAEYYTADGSPQDAACQGKPAWARAAISKSAVSRASLSSATCPTSRPGEANRNSLMPCRAASARRSSPRSRTVASSAGGKGDGSVAELLMTLMVRGVGQTRPSHRRTPGAGRAEAARSAVLGGGDGQATYPASEPNADLAKIICWVQRHLTGAHGTGVTKDNRMTHSCYCAAAMRVPRSPRGQVRRRGGPDETTHSLRPVGSGEHLDRSNRRAKSS